MNKCNIRRRLWILWMGLLVAGSVAADEGTIPATVSNVDLDRYLGTWYEIARLPNRFQDQCAGDVTAEYARMDDGRIQVINRCREAAGTMDEARGVARIVDAATNAKLEVSFLSLFGWQLFWGDYWILDLGDAYEYSVVGHPDRTYAWILARAPRLSPESRRRIDEVLARAGYDPARLVTTRHGERGASD